MIQQSQVWNHFKKITNSSQAKCDHCNTIIKCKGSSTSGLIKHLQRHDIEVKNKRKIENDIAENAEFQAPKLRMIDASILGYIKKPRLEEIISKMASLDGISIHALTNSTFIRESISSRGYLLPKNETHVMQLIHIFYEEEKNELIDQIKLNKTKFSLTLDH